MIKPGPAEGYSVPLSQVVQRLLDERISGGKRHFFLKPEFQQRLNLAGRDNILWVQVVSEVLYLRTVDVAVVTEPGSTEEQELHASELQSINVDENEPQTVTLVQSEAPDDAAAMPPPTLVVETSPDVDDKLDPVYGAFARAQAINRVLMESNTDRVPAPRRAVLSRKGPPVSPEPRRLPGFGRFSWRRKPVITENPYQNQ